MQYGVWRHVMLFFCCFYILVYGHHSCPSGGNISITETPQHYAGKKMSPEPMRTKWWVANCRTFLFGWTICLNLLVKKESDSWRGLWYIKFTNIIQKEERRHDKKKGQYKDLKRASETWKVGPAQFIYCSRSPLFGQWALSVIMGSFVAREKVADMTYSSQLSSGGKRGRPPKRIMSLYTQQCTYNSCAC